MLSWAQQAGASWAERLTESPFGDRAVEHGLAIRGRPGAAGGGGRRTSKKRVINDALRRALSLPTSRREPYRLEVHSATLRPGLDLAGFNRLADELEA
jgi:hypothetical protein